MSDVVTGGVSKVCLSGLFLVPAVCGDADILFLWVCRGYPSPEGFVTCFRGETWGEAQRDLHASAIFSNSVNLKYPHPKVPYLGYHVLNPIRIKSLLTKSGCVFYLTPVTGVGRTP